MMTDTSEDPVGEITFNTELNETNPETTFVSSDEKSLEQLQGYFSCAFCDRKMKTKKALRCHMKNQHRDFKKSVVMLETTNEATKLDEKKTVGPQLEVKENRFACHLCHKTYNWKGTLTKHVSRIHKNYAGGKEGTKNNSEGEMLLDKCLKEDNTAIEYEENEKSYNKNNSDKKESDAVTENKVQKKVMEGTDETIEEEEHINEDDTLSEVNEEFLCYFCDQCDHRTDSEESLSEHKQTEHAKLRCKKCNTELKNKGNFRRHYQYKHSEVSLDEFKELFYKVV